MSRKLLKSTAVISAMTLLSRLLGFLRDIIIAHSFGAGIAADAFFVAFRIPNFLRRLFAEGSFAQAFVPVLAEYRERHPPGEVKDLVDSISGVLGGLVALASVAGVLTAPWLVLLFAPGFHGDPSRYELTVALLRLTFPYLIFITLTALAGAILNSFERFAVPAFTPVLLNLTLIGCALLLAPQMDEPVTALALGVFAAGVLQLAFQLPFLHRLGLLPRPRFKRRNPGVDRILKRMVPTLLGSSVGQVNLLIDTLVASFLAAGSVSWLYYADRLVEFPLALIGTALGTAILPKLARQQARQDHHDFSHTLDLGLRLVVVVGLPAALGLALLAQPIVVTLFQYGQFSAEDGRRAGEALLAYALGLPAFLAIRILAPGFYARQDTRTPVRVALIAMAANLLLNVTLVFPLAHAGLALATALSACLNAGLLFRSLRRADAYRPRPGWPGLLGRVLAASTLMACVLWLLTPPLERWDTWGATDRAGYLLLTIAAAMAGYAVSLRLLGLRPNALLGKGG